MTASKHLQYRFIVGASEAAGSAAVATWYAAIMLAGLYLLTLVFATFGGGSWTLFDMVYQGLRPFMIAALAPSIGLVVGYIVTWATNDSADDDLHLTICLALGWGYWGLLTLVAGRALFAVPLPG